MNNASYKRQRGFSMIELIVVMAVMLVVLAAVFSLMKGTIATANANFEMTAASQGLRNSQEFLTRDILLAGDGMKGLANVWLPTAFVTSNLTSRTAADIDPGSLGFVNTGMAISDDNVPAGTVVNHVTPARSVLANTDRLTVLTRDASFSPIDLGTADVNYVSGLILIPAARIGDFGVGEIYFLSNGVSGVFGTVTHVDGAAGKITMGDGDSMGLNRVGPTGQLASVTNYGTYPVVLKRIQIVNYYVDDENRLTRRVFGVKGGALIDNVVAEHVRSLQFRYVLKPADPATILDQPKTQITPGESVLVRTIEPSLVVETAYPLQDGQIHDVEGFTSIGVRNLQFNDALVPRDSNGDADLPDPGPTPVITPTPPPPTPPPTPPPPTPTPTPTPTPSPTATPPPTPTPSPTATPTPPPPTPTPPPTPVPTPTPTGT